MKIYRIKILDGFRSLAIIAVMLFHFFSRYIPPRSQVSLYPYKNSYDYFGYGYLGVQFFFMISGFVIFFTLDKTENFILFWKKRFVRLFPSILIASLLTFTICSIFDVSFLFPSSHEVKNFIPSLTFISPIIFNIFLSHSDIKLDYISGSYWSLWPEIQFYLYVSVLYFFNKNGFVRNFSIISIILIVINHVFLNIQGSNTLNIELPFRLLETYSEWILNCFDLIKYLPFFSIGVLFYLLFRNRQNNQHTSLNVKICLGFLLLFTIYVGGILEIRLIYITMFSLFFIFIYFPNKLSVFENKILTDVGESSYFLYLIHENIGILIIYFFCHFFLPFGFLFSFITMCLLTLFSLYYSLIEKKILKRLKLRP